MTLSPGKSKKVFWLLNALLGAGFLIELALGKGLGAVDGAILLLAAVTSVLALNRHLPLQNLLPAAGLAALIGGAAHGFSSNPNYSLPFGPVVFDSAAGASLFHFVPWTIPLLWVAALFDARGVARLMLRPWRKVKDYGFWLIGLTSILMVAFDVALEPYATYAKHLWHWQPTKIIYTWGGATVLNFISWAGISLLVLMLATPALIRKQPGSPSAPDFHPLALWLGALILFAAGAAGARLWWPLAVDAVIAIATAVFAVRGAKW